MAGRSGRRLHGQLRSALELQHSPVVGALRLPRRRQAGPQGAAARASRWLEEQGERPAADHCGLQLRGFRRARGVRPGAAAGDGRRVSQRWQVQRQRAVRGAAGGYSEQEARRLRPICGARLLLPGARECQLRGVHYREAWACARRWRRPRRVRRAAALGRAAAARLLHAAPSRVVRQRRRLCVARSARGAPSRGCGQPDGLHGPLVGAQPQRQPGALIRRPPSARTSRDARIPPSHYQSRPSRRSCMRAGRSTSQAPRRTRRSAPSAAWQRRRSTRSGPRGRAARAHRGSRRTARACRRASCVATCRAAPARPPRSRRGP